MSVYKPICLFCYYYKFRRVFAFQGPTSPQFQPLQRTDALRSPTVLLCSTPCPFVPNLFVCPENLLTFLKLARYSTSSPIATQPRPTQYNFDFDEGLEPSKKFHCETCGKKFARKNDLKRHILSIHSEHTYTCSHCDSKFGRKDAMICHNKTAHTANDYSCEDCDVSFSRREDLGRHVITVHNEKTYSCAYCENVKNICLFQGFNLFPNTTAYHQRFEHCLNCRI